MDTFGLEIQSFINKAFLFVYHCLLPYIHLYNDNIRLGGIMFSVLASTMGCSPGGVKPKTKTLVFAVPLLNMMLLHEGTKCKNWLGRRQDNVSEWSNKPKMANNQNSTCYCRQQVRRQIPGEPYKQQNIV